MLRLLSLQTRKATLSIALSPARTRIATVQNRMASTEATKRPKTMPMFSMQNKVRWLFPVVFDYSLTSFI